MLICMLQMDKEALIMLHHEVRSVLMDSLALAVFLKQPNQDPRQLGESQVARPVAPGGVRRFLMDGLSVLRRSLARDERRPGLSP